MDVHEERALDEGASATNSQSEADVGERSGQPQQSQTPPLRSAVASDADDEKEEDREEETSGTLWGHARLPQSVYGNNPAATGKRKSTNNAVWNVVKHLKEHTAHSVVVDTKYTHVCVAPITASESGELGADVDSDGNSLWFCNKVFTLSKTKNCYRSSQATRHCGKFHGDTSSAGKALVDRTSHNNTHKRHVMEAASLKAGQQTSGQRSGAAALYTITNQELCLGQVQFGYLPTMALANIGAMNAESFCERILSCASLVVTDLHTSLDHEEVRMLTMLRMNKSLMEYMRKEYDNLHSHIEARNSNHQRAT